MAADAIVRSRIDNKSKAAATAVLDDIGLTMSDAIRMFIKQIANTGTIPFELRTPNAASRKAIQEAKQIRETFDSVEELWDDLDGKNTKQEKIRRTA